MSQSARTATIAGIQERKIYVDLRTKLSFWIFIKEDICTGIATFSDSVFIILTATSLFNNF